MASQSRSAAPAVSSLINFRLLLVLLVLIVFENSGVLGGKSARNHIPNESDDQEDDAWKEGGTTKKVSEDAFDLPQTDLSDMDLTEMQTENMKRLYGPSFDFVKLRSGVRRTLEMITDIARKWSKIARTGAIEVKFMGVDVSRTMYTLEKGQDTLEHDDPEDGDIAISGDSHMELQQSRSLNHERGDSSLLPLQPDRRLHLQTQVDQKLVQESNNYKPEQGSPVLKAERTPPAMKIGGKPTRTNPISAPSHDAAEQSKERSYVKVKNASETMMTEAIQRKCKYVITKTQGRIDKEGLQIIPLLFGLWNRTESPGSSGENSLLGLRKIELRIERLEYSGVMDLIADVQAMLNDGMQYFGFSHEVRSEATKVYDLFCDIMKMTFRDTDFQDARSALTISSSMSSSSLRGLLRIGQTKQPKQMVNPEYAPLSLSL